MADENIRQITPFMHVDKMERAFEFFALIGFECLFQERGYAYFQRGPAAVRVMQSTKEESGTPHEPHRGFCYYVDVADVDPLVAEIAPKLHVAGVEFMGPRNQPYFQREFMIRAPDGNVFVFGAPIPR